MKTYSVHIHCTMYMCGLLSASTLSICVVWGVTYLLIYNVGIYIYNTYTFLVQMYYIMCGLVCDVSRLYYISAPSVTFSLP